MPEPWNCQRLMDSCIVPCEVHVFRTIREYHQLFGRRGLLVSARRALSRGITEVEVFAPGIRHPLRLRLRTSDISTFKQVFLDQEYALDLSRQPENIIDAGANIGLTSIYLAGRYPEARILSIEPEQSNFSLLEKNTKPYPNVVPIRAAVWKENSTIDLVDPGLGHWAFQTQGPEDRVQGNKLSAVRGVTVDALMRDHGIDYVDILKMDIEGSEKEVFEGATQWVEKVGVLIVELHDRFRPGCSRSFYNATNCFDREWIQGGSVVLAQRGHLQDGTVPL